jgi:hypothetical protein
MAQVARRAAPRGNAERLREMSRHRAGPSGGSVDGDRPGGDRRRVGDQFIARQRKVLLFTGGTPVPDPLRSGCEPRLGARPCRGAQFGRQDVVSHVTWAEPELGIGEWAFRQVPDGRPPGRQAPAAYVRPPGDGRGPPGADRSARQVTPAVVGAEVHRRSALVGKDPGGDAVATVFERDVKGGVSGQRPRNRQGQQHGWRKEHGVVEVGDQFARVILGTRGVRDGHQPRQLAAHLATAVYVSVPAGHRQHPGRGDPHVEQARDRRAAVVLPCLAAHPWQLRPQPEPPGEMRQER